MGLALNLIDSRLFNHSMPKEGNSGIIDELNSVQSTDMKYQLDKIFSFL